MKLLRLFLASLAMMTATFSHAEPIIRIFEMHIRPESVQAFTELGKHNIRQSVNTEQGVLGMYVMTDKQDPSRFYIVEAYADEAAYQAHRASPHFQSWLKTAQDMIVSRKVVETDPVVFGSKAVPVK
ncbi:MAG: putative quinol monooxygenase [Neisseria sp.]|uniref:putative quinol monooxygenase n=1 Tax=Neisseria sp. TaxID=192066 RepID=UPI0026DBCA9D|nr:putative quinol monooxygenase [Neisseria sp.]MDO4249845.1 putative quinol monooxygenase [Neisseria sp.]